MSTRKRASPWAHLLHPFDDEDAPNHDPPPDPWVITQQSDGSRVMTTTNDAGKKVVLWYVHGPEWWSEFQRLGITTSHVRFRQTPLFNPDWTELLHPPELTRLLGAPIPEELRGRTGTFVVDPKELDLDKPRWTGKYVTTAEIRLHRPLVGEAGLEQVEVPLVWLEGADKPEGSE